MFICTYGTDAVKNIAHLKKLLAAAYVKMAGDSDVFFERPLLSDGAKTRFLLWNKTENKFEFNAEARFDKEYLIKDEDTASPAKIVK